MGKSSRVMGHPYKKLINLYESNLNLYNMFVIFVFGVHHCFSHSILISNKINVTF